MGMKKIIAALLLVACTDTSEPTLGERVSELCGPAPTFPSFPAGIERLESGRLMVAITTDAYGALVRYRLDALAWQDCVVGLPAESALAQDPLLVRTVSSFDPDPAIEALLDTW